MLLAIAFLMFAVLMVAWLMMPDNEPEALPAAKPIRPETESAAASA